MSIHLQTRELQWFSTKPNRLNVIRLVQLLYFQQYHSNNLN